MCFSAGRICSTMSHNAVVLYLICLLASSISCNCVHSSQDHSNAAKKDVLVTEQNNVIQCRSADCICSTMSWNACFSIGCNCVHGSQEHSDATKAFWLPSTTMSSVCASVPAAFAQHCHTMSASSSVAIASIAAKNTATQQRLSAAQSWHQCCCSRRTS